MEHLPTSIIIVGVAAVIIGTMRLLMAKKLGQLQGHQKFVHLITLLTALFTLALLGYVWNIYSVVVGGVAAAGALGLILGFALVPWITDSLVGISLYFSRDITIGSEVEIDGKRGRIIRIDLTTTRISGDESVIIVPNRLFREGIVQVRSTRYRPLA